MVSPMELAAIAGAAILLFGAERLPKLARSAGEMRREFLRGQTESEAEGLPKPDSPAVASPVPPLPPEVKDHEHHPE